MKGKQKEKWIEQWKESIRSSDSEQYHKFDIQNFKELTQKHPAVIAFYLPCLEIHRHRSERSRFRDLLNEMKTNCGGIIGIQRACERIDARLVFRVCLSLKRFFFRYFSKSAIITLNPESTTISMRTYTDTRGDVRRSMFSSVSRLTQPSVEREESNPIKIRKTENQNPNMSPAEVKQTPIQAPKEVEYRKSITPEKQEEVIREKMAVPKIRDPADEKENIEVSRKSRPSVKQEFKVPVQTPRSNSVSTVTSHTPQYHAHSQQPARQTKRIHIKDKTYQILDKLGQGGFSKVYKCLDNHHGMCALKFVDLAKVWKNQNFQDSLS